MLTTIKIETILSPDLALESKLETTANIVIRAIIAPNQYLEESQRTRLFKERLRMESNCSAVHR